MKHVDVRQLACPGPVLELRRLLDSGESTIRLHVNDDLARSNVSRFARSRGARIRSEPTTEGGFLVEIEAATGALPVGDIDDLSAFCDPGLVQESLAGRRSPVVVQISAATMGRGDEELGELLLRSFVKTLCTLEQPPDAVICYNGGVRLCCGPSPVAADLRNLERVGVEILVCGTCLNFFGLGSALAVGRVTDMLEIATRLAEAGHLVRP